MDVVINELTSTVEVGGEEMALEPTVLREIVRAVTSTLQEEEATRRWEARERRPDRPA